MIDRADDRDVLQHLVGYGSDLSRPHHTIHFLYFKSKAAAETAADELRAAGYENVRVDRAPTLSLWARLFAYKQFSCIAETHVVPSEAAVFATTDRMNALAAKHGGNYDGWEAGIESAGE